MPKRSKRTARSANLHNIDHHLHQLTRVSEAPNLPPLRFILPPACGGGKIEGSFYPLLRWQ